MGPGAEWRCGNSLEAQRLGVHFLTAEDLGSIPGQGTKILQAMHPGKKKKRSCVGGQDGGAGYTKWCPQ